MTRCSAVLILAETRQDENVKLAKAIRKTLDVASLQHRDLAAFPVQPAPTAARRDYFAGSNSGVVGQDVREVDDVVEKFTVRPHGCRG
jgi:hypothetical protein